MVIVVIKLEPYVQILRVDRQFFGAATWQTPTLHHETFVEAIKYGRGGCSTHFCLTISRNQRFLNGWASASNRNQFLEAGQNPTTTRDLIVEAGQKIATSTNI